MADFLKARSVTGTEIPYSVGIPPFTSLTSAITGTSAGSVLNMGVTRNSFGLQVNSTGSPTAIVQMQVSNDGSNWTTLGSYSAGTDSQGTMKFFANSPAVYARANISTYASGASQTVTAIISAV